MIFNINFFYIAFSISLSGDGRQEKLCYLIFQAELYLGCLLELLHLGSSLAFGLHEYLVLLELHELLCLHTGGPILIFGLRTAQSF